MPRLLAAIAWIGAALLTSSSAAADRPEQRRVPLVIAHRGGALLYPENTFPAFDNAVRIGADMLEFDMQLTADDQLVITHDGTVNASFCSPDLDPNAKPGPVRSLPLKELLTFDCGSRHRAIYPTEQAVPHARMPTPDAFFARYAGTRELFFGETKMPAADEGAVDPVSFTRLVAKVVERHGLQDRFILQSSDYRSIDAMHDIDPRIRTCLLTPWRFGTDFMAMVVEHHAKCIVLRPEDVNADQVSRLRTAGIMVFSNVVDDEAGWRAYRALGFDALFTNDPVKVIAYLKQ